MIVQDKDSIMVRWEDDMGNLFEANILQREPDRRVFAYLKQWTVEGKRPVTEGTLRVIWEAEAPPAEPAKLEYTIKRLSQQYGCPEEDAIQFINLELQDCW